jgi:glucose/arabinose dehydrogenase
LIAIPTADQKPGTSACFSAVSGAVSGAASGAVSRVVSVRSFNGVPRGVGSRTAKPGIYTKGGLGWWLQDDNTAWGRPVDLLVMPDGALLLADDGAGVIYRISY